ncbi:putative Mitochondrial DNA helicase [Taphrina deformans PYCC 5710]|uniref:ATP-dependent DNA helicase PIF1 n=1 Tax=Taphrina deformans (strain PYCC 5710 / ATCC 11124 / CBS 356.35 / IMI 108563 / JCM 9778 / NBRC 8474) TaxID=1097556 RepID=R4XBB5_TAPDE|nr:putative Mitochondrial DNA helicase [Taphrina deformans PYCC 5710]|eukprot:CCG81646.1 putative Mitochondrial DNA helicase [Taphrina deformans PYCC 5710]
MFQRAATSAAPQPKSQSYQNQPFRLSQPCTAPARTLPPLSPQKSSVINARTGPESIVIPSATAKRKYSLLAAINDNTSTKYAARVETPDVASAVYFNEDDFDDDMNFDFDTTLDKSEINAHVSSPAISWPPSSYPTRSPINLDQKKADRAESVIDVTKAQELDRSSEGQFQTRSMPSPTPSLVKKPRTLPWLVSSASQTMRGPIAMQKRPASTAVASKEEEIETDEVAPLVIRPDPYNMTHSAVKAAIKGRGRKRETDDKPAPALSLPVHKTSQVKEVAKVFLSAEQRGVIEMLKTGKSVFFTGSAGTGKSVLLRSAIQELRQKHKKLETVAVTASTGLAACNIGGITLHSFAGVGLGRESVAEMIKKVKRNKKNLTRWLKTKVLIVDEISMVDADFFDKLEAVARKLRANDKPWGGIQLVATGDFFQLPPVPDSGKVSKFAFEAEKWGSLDATIQLTTVFRQKDEEFVEMLNQMRTGSLSARTISNFKELSRPLNFNDGIIPTELFPTRNEVENANALRMRQLPGSIYSYEADDSGSILDTVQRTKLLANCMAPARLDLKKGAQVMLIKNRDDGLVNGSLGVVIGFMNEKTYTYATEGGEAEFDESVLRDSPWTDAELEVMSQTPAGQRKFLKLKQMQDTAATQRCWPLVRFKSPNGGQDMTQLMSPESWKIELPNGDVQACRKQVPLILAYAISIHKAQGQTIERVKVDLGKVFEKGQAYVALSRAVSKEGLQVLRFDVKRVMAHPKVSAFYRELMAASDAVEVYKKDYIKPERETKNEIFDDKDDFDNLMTTQEVFSQIKREPLKAYAKSKAMVGRMM